MVEVKKGRKCIVLERKKGGGIREGILSLLKRHARTARYRASEEREGEGTSVCSAAK